MKHSGLREFPVQKIKMYLFGKMIDSHDNNEIYFYFATIKSKISQKMRIFTKKSLIKQALLSVKIN